MPNTYFNRLTGLFDKIEVTSGDGSTLGIDAAMHEVVSLLGSLRGSRGKVYLIGNGASAAIASHISADLLKNGGIPALVFNDPAQLTCISNDLGYEQVFALPLKLHAHKDDVLVSISSSGRSRNILDGVSAASEKGCFIVTLSGFDENNPLRAMGGVNFYVPSHSYGTVEVIHHAICHHIADALKA